MGVELFQSPIGMAILRSKKTKSIEVAGQSYLVQIVEIPFREGVELVCEVNGEEVRVSDRGLGEHEAFRLLVEEIERRVG